MQNIITEKQTINDCQKKENGSQRVRIKEYLSSWATVGPAENKHKEPAKRRKYLRLRSAPS